MFNRITQQFHRRPLLFSVLWFSVFAVFFAGFFQRGWVPSLFRGDTTEDEGPHVTLFSGPVVEASESRTEALPVVVGRADTPVRLVSQAVDLDVQINNPNQRDVGILNESLQSGAVHYPGSGNLEDTSNMFIFGHSTNWPVVRNQAYKAFNGLDDLEIGDTVSVYSETYLYEYRVSSVTLVDAREAWVQFESSTKKLTLSTCNTFGEVQDRYVVEADFIGKRAL